jgi:hypothetical protein
MCLKIKADTLDILKGKFAETIAKIEGVYTEAKGDMKVNQSYSPLAVFNRANSIRDAFYKDLENLSKDITNEN